MKTNIIKSFLILGIVCAIIFGATRDTNAQTGTIGTEMVLSATGVALSGTTGTIIPLQTLAAGAGKWVLDGAVVVTTSTTAGASNISNPQVAITVAGNLLTGTAAVTSTTSIVHRLTSGTAAPFVNASVAQASIDLRIMAQGTTPAIGNVSLHGHYLP